MAGTTLDLHGASSASQSISVTVDYDGTSTVGITLTGQAGGYIITLTVNGTTITVDCVLGSTGNLLGKGRQILFGPGSIIGQTQRISKVNSWSVSWNWGGV